MVKVGAVDADQHQSLAGQFGVRGFPTIKVFGANKKKPEDFNGARSAQGLTEAGLKAAKDMVNARIGGKVRTGGPRWDGVQEWWAGGPVGWLFLLSFVEISSLYPKSYVTEC